MPYRMHEQPTLKRTRLMNVVKTSFARVVACYYLPLCCVVVV